MKGTDFKTKGLLQAGGSFFPFLLPITMELKNTIQ